MDDTTVGQEATKPFLKKGWGFYFPFTDWRLDVTKIVPGSELMNQKPLLFYMDDEGDVKVYKNIQTGVHYPKDKFGRKLKDMENLIEARKIKSFHYGGYKIPSLWHYSRERFGYPHEPKFDSQELTKTVRTIQNNYKDWELREQKFTQDQLMLWLKVAGYIGIGVLVFFYAWGTFGLQAVFNNMFGGGGGQAVVETVVQNVTNNPPPVII